MQHVILARALFPESTARLDLLHLIAKAGVNVGSVTELASRDFPDKSNAQLINRIKAFKQRRDVEKILIVAFSLADPNLHVVELFRTLELFKLPLFPPVGMVFEPDWTSVARAFGKDPGRRFLRIPYVSMQSDIPQSAHLLQMCEHYTSSDAEQLSWHLGLRREPPRRISEVDETLKIVLSGGPRHAHDDLDDSERPTLSPPPPNAASKTRKD